MHSCVPMHINVKRPHLLLQQNPNHLVVPFVRGPVQRCVLATLLSILGLNEWVIDFLATHSKNLLLSLIGVFSLLLLVCVLGTGVVFYQDSDYLFVAVTGSPEQRGPSVLVLAGRTGMN